MIVRSTNYLSFDSVMWQPIFLCRLTKKCQGCYIAASPSAHNTPPFSSELLDLIYYNDAPKLACEQFTISLDTLAREDFATQRVQALLLALKDLWRLYERAEDCNCQVTRRYLNGEQLPELCVTAHTFRTVKTWATMMGFSLERFLAPLTMLSLSRFPSRTFDVKALAYTVYDSRTRLNYNRMIDVTSEKDWKMLPAEFYNGIFYSDHTYLVYKKAPLGCWQSKEQYEYYLKVVELLASRSRENWRGEKFHLTIDACVTDSMRFRKSGFNVTCGAGITKIHVWPDGSVSGCPYDSWHIMQGQRTNHNNTSLWAELVNMTQQRHAMTQCRIHELLSTQKEV